MGPYILTKWYQNAWIAECGCRGLLNHQSGPTVSECLFRAWKEFSVNVRKTFSVEAPKRTLFGTLLDLLEDRPRWRLVMVETAPVSVETTQIVEKCWNTTVLVFSYSADETYSSLLKTLLLAPWQIQYLEWFHSA